VANSSSVYKFRKSVNIGALTAEEDAAFLSECFIDTGLLSATTDKHDFRRLILGRTGAGKSALFIRLSEQANTIVINPDELALDYLSNSEILKQLHECGISLTPFYKLLWKHVFAVEVLRQRHEQLREGENAKGWWGNFLNGFSRSVPDQTSKEALEYLTQFGDNFWQTTDYRVREITERMERQIQAKLAAKLGTVSTEVGGSQLTAEERKIALEHIGREFVQAIQIKKLNEAVKWLAGDMEGQPSIFIILDKLDTAWAETQLRLQLIRALIDTAQEFKVVTNVKILIALREDLFETIITTVAASEPGFQREKYTQLCHQVHWTRDELKMLVEARVNKLMKNAYTTAKVKIEDVMEPVEGQPGIVYLIERTLLRPRDVIAFFNKCIEQTNDTAKITRKMILAAEPNYSVGRLKALADEWGSIEPLVSEVAELFRGRKADLRLSDITDEGIKKICESLYLNHWNKSSPLGAAAKLHCECPEKMSANTVRRMIINLLYKVGVIGVKPTGPDKYQWASEGPPTVDHLELTENCGVKVHKTFWKALNIAGKGQGQVDGSMIV
jgi:hypothetical protein